MIHCVNSIHLEPWSLPMLNFPRRYIISSSMTWNGVVVILGQQSVILHPLQYCIQTRVYCIHWILRQSWSCYLHREVIRAFPWLGSIRWFEEKLCYQQTSRLCTPNLRVLHWSWYYMILDGCRQSKIGSIHPRTNERISHMKWTCVFDE